ncbi:MAG: acetyl-CoA decarbonylase/synthase complex subunit delta [Elusimicrobia bacterium RIFOXYA2_FULL_39_19]|nr:MAG: acetyl-CoA decarbonylase/synthase complex subunit delta [Elusimicrobia bacterium RIFOXYA2_FULL_39_19]
MEKVIEKAVSKISELAIGATSANGGTREKELKIGGQSAMPFLHFEGSMPNAPVVALEVWDTVPEEWPLIADEFKDIVNDPIKWAQKGKEWGADLISLRLESCHPDNKNNSAAYAADLVKKVLAATKLPLIVIGCGHPEKDQEILPAVAEAAKGEKILLGMATKDNYKTIVAAALASGHSIIAESPLDINLAKQLNILVSDMSMPLERIAMHHTTGGLGYGFEYCYSIMERCRLAGLAGDKIMATPIINMIADETWKTKEAKTPQDEQPNWGDLHKRAINWEIACAAGYLQSGADILVLAHPESIKQVKQTIGKLK